MIESHLDPLIDGIGGAPQDGDLTIAGIAEQFRFLASEGCWRSFTAVLRIVAEQSKGRTEYQGCLVVSIALSVVTFSMVGLAGWVHRNFAVVSSRGVVEYGLVCGVFSLGCVLWVRPKSRRGLTQRAELGRLAIETLEAIVANPAFAAKELDNERLKVFRKLRSTDPNAWNRIALRLVEAPK